MNTADIIEIALEDPDEIERHDVDKLLRGISFEEGGEGDEYRYGDNEGNRNPVRQDTWPILERLTQEQEDRIGYPPTIVEAGTGRGVSGICFLRNASRGTELHTIEWDEDAAREAERNFVRAGVDDHTTVYAGDAGAVLERYDELADGGIDVLFLDHAKEFYGRELQLAEPHLNDGALILMDNVIDRKDELSDARQRVVEDADYHAAPDIAAAAAPEIPYDEETHVLRTGEDEDIGLSISRYQPADGH